MKASVVAFFLLSAIAPYISAQGTVQLTLATSNDETAATLEVPFNKLFDASSSQRGVSIQVSTGSDVPVEQDQITCQCFSDTAGTKPLGDTFTNEFPGTEIGEEPVQIGSIYCSDADGLKQQMGGSNAGNGDGNNNAQAPPSPPPPPPPVSSPPAQAPAPAVTTLQTSTAATSPTATSTAAISGLNSPPSSSGSDSGSGSSSSSSSNGGSGSGSGNNNGPVVVLKFLLSSDPSDDSATQTSVAIDRSIVPIGGKQASGVEVITLDGPKVAGELVCQAFADEKAQEPLGMGFGMTREADFGGEGLTSVGAVGCAMLSGTEFGGMVGLVAA
ncbi:MAG: hypothetical protein LQ342_001918 [Letrouitia transgressa]|nr:MAG: hypothetical protein LQ342_001918 [Letrouitia transgressa]